MSKFEIEDIKVGDKVTLVGIVKENDESSFPIWVQFEDGSHEWFKVGAISAREARPFKIGDRVKDTTLMSAPEFAVIGVDGDEIWLRQDDGERWSDTAADYALVS